MKQITALYARVSTSTQEEEATIESQIAAIKTYIHEKDYDLPDDYFFLDQSVSGAHLERPALDELRHLATEGAFSVLVCYSPDRLSRRYAHQWVIIDELEKQGVRVEFVNQPDLGDNPQAQLLLGVQGLFAEYEQAMIKERLRLGRLYKIQTGQLMHNTPPYGYRYVPRDESGGGSYWLIDEREADAVRQIFAWYTDDEQLTLWQITKRLNQDYRHVLRKAKAWHLSTVHNILQHTTYIGRTYFNKKRVDPDSRGTPLQIGHGPRKSPRLIARPQSEWIEVEVPVIIDEAVWLRAQERLELNQRFAQRNNKKHFYLLRSLLVCDCCGHTLQGRSQNGRISYFCQYGSKKRYEGVPEHRNTIAGNIIEPLVWDAIAELLKHPNQIFAAWESQSEDDEKPNQLTRLQKRLTKLERQWKRLLDAFQDGLIEKSDLSSRKTRLDQERQVLTEQIAHLQRNEMQQQVKDQVLEDFIAYCDTIQGVLDNPTPQVKQEVLRLLIKEIVVGKDMITIKHIIPIGDFSRLLPRDICRNYPYKGQYGVYVENSKHGVTRVVVLGSHEHWVLAACRDYTALLGNPQPEENLIRGVRALKGGRYRSQGKSLSARAIQMTCEPPQGYMIAYRGELVYPAFHDWRRTYGWLQRNPPHGKAAMSWDALMANYGHKYRITTESYVGTEVDWADRESVWEI